MSTTPTTSTGPFPTVTTTPTPSSGPFPAPTTGTTPSTGAFPTVDTGATPGGELTTAPYQAWFQGVTPPAQTSGTNASSGPFPSTSTTTQSPDSPKKPLPPNRRKFKLVGDPHATAGDGKKFNDELVGTITQLKSASGDFELQTTQEHPPGNKKVTVNTAAALKLGNNTVSYDLTRHQLVVNHKPVKLKPGASLDLPGGGTVKMGPKGHELTVTSAQGDVVNLHMDKTKKGVPLLDIDGSLGPGRTDGEVGGALGNFHAGNGNDFIGRDGKAYDKSSVQAFEKSWLVSGKSLLEQNQGKGTDSQQWLHDANSVAQQSGSKSKLNLPSSGGPLKGSSTKDGHSLMATSGRATTFWNGNYAYKGQRDTENMSQGAWGDPNMPTQYFCALPDALKDSNPWWHNQKIVVTNPSNGKQVVVQIQDKGPSPSTGNAIDLSPVAKEALGVNFTDNLNVNFAFAPDGSQVGPVA